MELIWKELPGERIIYTGVSQGTVEGGIPLPEAAAQRRYSRIPARWLYLHPAPGRAK